MSVPISTRSKPGPTKKALFIIAGSVLLLFLIIGGLIWQFTPLLRQQISCPFCQTTSPADIYITSHTDSQAFVSQTFLYSINGQTGQARDIADLHQTGPVLYQKIINGVSYEIFSNGVNGFPGNNDSLLAIRLSDGKILWKKSLGNVLFKDAIFTPTKMYLYVNAQPYAPSFLNTITALNLQDGHELWRFEPQADASILLDNDTLYVAQSGSGDTGLDEQVFALHASDGTVAWSHPFDNSSAFRVVTSLVVDDGHLFFVSGAYQQPYVLTELDQNNGSSFKQKQLDMQDVSSDLRIINHTLFIECRPNDENRFEIFALRETDLSLLWSTQRQQAVEIPNVNVIWTYSDDIVYSQSNEVDPKTFATNRVLRGWQLSTGKVLFQVNTGIVGTAHVLRMGNQLILCSTNGFGDMHDPMHNDIEARQAQTGALLWHIHLDQLPAKEEQIDFTALASGSPQSDNFSDTVYYRIDKDRPDPSILYIKENDENHNHSLYALNVKNGHILWKLDTPTLNTDARLHSLVEFATPTYKSNPQSITTGPDGNLWFTESVNPSHIGRITPSGQITEFSLPNPDSIPRGITTGPDGNLWFTETGNHGQSQIGRITTDGHISEFPVSGSPSEIVTGPDGNLWFTQNSPDLIARMTPTGTVTQFPLPPSPILFRIPLGITVGPDKNLWFTEAGAGGQVGRITTSGTITEFPVPPPDTTRSRAAQGITTGPDGNLWFIEANFDSTVQNGNMIVRITPSGILTEFALPAEQNLLFGGSAPAGITTDHDGNLWFTEAGANRIVRMTPKGDLTYYPLLTDQSGPSAITIGQDGKLWFVESNANQIGRMTLPATSVPASMHASITPVPTTAPTPAVTSTATTFTPFQTSDFSINYPGDWKQKQDGNNYSFTRSDGITQFAIGLHNQDQSPAAIINNLTHSVLSCSPQNPPVPATLTVNNRTWQQTSWSCYLAHSIYTVHLLTYTDSQTSNTTAIVYGAWQTVASDTVIDFDHANTLYFQPMLQSFQLT